MNKAAAFFDIAKLDHFNATYIQALEVDTFVDQVLPFLRDDDRWNAEDVDPDLIRAFAPEVQQRISTLGEAGDWYDWMLVETIEYDEKSVKKGLQKAKGAKEVLDGVIEAFKECAWEADVLNATVRGVGDELGVRSAVPVRVAVTGKMGGIPLYEPLERLGRETTLERLRNVRDNLTTTE